MTSNFPPGLTQRLSLASNVSGLRWPMAGTGTNNEREKRDGGYLNLHPNVVTEQSA